MPKRKNATAIGCHEPDLVGGRSSSPCNGRQGPVERQERLEPTNMPSRVGGPAWHPTGVQPCRPATARQRSDTEAGEARRRSRPLRSAGRLSAFCAPRVPWSDMKLSLRDAPLPTDACPTLLRLSVSIFSIMTSVLIRRCRTVARKTEITVLFAKVCNADRRLSH